MPEMLSINEAIAKGIARLRLDNWASPKDHLEFYITGSGAPGPWVNLWSDDNEAIGQKNPQQILITTIGDLDATVWREYTPQ